MFVLLLISHYFFFFLFYFTFLFSLFYIIQFCVDIVLFCLVQSDDAQSWGSLENNNSTNLANLNTLLDPSPTKPMLPEPLPTLSHQTNLVQTQTQPTDVRFDFEEQKCCWFWQFKDQDGGKCQQVLHFPMWHFIIRISRLSQIVFYQIFEDPSVLARQLYTIMTTITKF